MGTLASPKHEAFAQGLAFGFSASMAAEEAGLNLSSVQAAHLTLHPEVVARVDELTKTQQFDMSNEHLRVARQLEVDRDFAYRVGNPAAAINATVHRAKVLGVYVERFASDNKVAVSSPEALTPEEWSAKFGGQQ